MMFFETILGDQNNFKKLISGLGHGSTYLVARFQWWNRGQAKIIKGQFKSQDHHLETILAMYSGEMWGNYIK